MYTTHLDSGGYIPTPVKMRFDSGGYIPVLVQPRLDKDGYIPTPVKMLFFFVLKIMGI